MRVRSCWQWVVMTMVLAATSSGQRAEVSKIPIPTTVIALAITPQGFDPPTLTITEGNTFFSVYNRTALPDLSLQLDRAAEGAVASQKVKEAPLARTKKAWRDGVDLTPGTYTISVTEIPKMQFQLIVRVK